jgi:SAM-dependent methyltransferase
MIRDPLAGSSWSAPGTVAGFVQSPPNATLMAIAAQHWRPGARLLDIGCGAGRNAVPLARAGWHVVGTDLSSAMLAAAATRVADERLASHLTLALAPMDCLPLATASCDFVVAHGIWNLARTDREFAAALREAARVARPGAPLFLFTFSRNTLPPAATPVAGERFVFTQFSGQPQIFLTGAEILDVLDEAGFEPDQSLPLRELNRQAPCELAVRTAPVIYEGLFRRRTAPVPVG